jgi:hypothetical protein
MPNGTKVPGSKLPRGATADQNPTSALSHLQTCPAQEGVSASPLLAVIKASGQPVR